MSMESLHQGQDDDGQDGVDAVFAALTRRLVDDASPAGDTAPGRTRRVRELEAAAAESALVAALPTARVLAVREQSAESAALEADSAATHAERLRRAGERERAELRAQADSAAARRELETDPAVRALALGRLRRRRVGLLWGVMLAAMAYTCVNVARFAAAGAPVWSPVWLVSWLVDPLLALLVIALLLMRGDVAASGSPLSVIATRRSRRLLAGVEIAFLGASVGMNVAPEIGRDDPRPALLVLHLVVPLASVAAALLIPVVQDAYAVAIDRISPADPLPAHTAHTAVEQGGLSARAAAALPIVSGAIERGELPERPGQTRTARYVRERLGECSIPTAAEVLRHLARLADQP